MIEQITKLIQQVSEKETGANNITADLANAVTKETGDSIINGFKDSVSSRNIAGLTDLFSGSASGIASNPIVSGMISNLIGGLTQKVGLPESVSKNFAGSVIPKVIESMVSKSKNGDSGFQITDLVSSFGGGSSKSILDSLTDGKEGLGGAIDGLKGLFK